MKRFVRRLQGWWTAGRHDAELAEEIEFHRAMIQERLEQRGAAPEAAAAASRRTLGNVTLAREDARSVWIWPFADSIRQDVAYALRALRHSPGFAVLAVAALAAAIGLNTSLFTVFNALVLKRWPVADADRVITIFNQSRHDVRRRGGGAPAGFSLDQVSHFAATAKTLSGVIAMRSGGGDQTLGEDDAPVGWVSGNYFQVLGVQMAHGRGFTDEEDRTDSPVPVAVLSHGYWQRRFGGDTSIVGKTARFDDLPFTIVGVTAQSFTGTAPDRVDVWMPMATARLLRPDDRWVRNILLKPENCCVAVAARLAPGATREEAQAELSVLNRSFRSERLPSVAVEDHLLRVSGTEFAADPKSDSRAVFLPMFGGVFLVLLLACANVGNLLIARAAARRREIAVRLSLGASRWRIVRQLLTESAVLAVIAGGVGLWIAYWLPGRLVTLVSTTGNLQLDPDWRVLGYVLALSALCSIAFGAAPAVHGTRIGVANALKDGIAASGGRLGLRSVLLAVQVAVAAALLAAAGLLSRAVYDAYTRDLGFTLQGMSVVSIEAPPRGFDPSRLRASALQLSEELAPVEAARALAFTSTAPLGSGNIKGAYHLPGSNDEENNAVYEVSPSYFDVLGIRVLAGRPLNADDSRLKAIVISETMARRHWTVQSAIGQRIVVDAESAGWNTVGELEIVGVAADATMTGIGDDSPVIYQPVSHRTLPQIVFRTGDAAARDGVLAAVARVDSRLIARAKPLSDNLAPRVRASRLGATLAGAMGLLALALASIGLFGVFAYWVQQRTHEIGVRMALGARPRQVVSVMVRSSVWSIAAGAALGIVGALMASGMLRSYMFGLSALDPVAYAAVVLLLAAAGVVATYVPARRATRVDPVVALRYE